MTSSTESKPAKAEELVSSKSNSSSIPEVSLSNQSQPAPDTTAHSPSHKDAHAAEHDSHHHNKHHHFHMPHIHSPFGSPKLKPVTDAFDNVLNVLAPEVQDITVDGKHKTTSLGSIGHVP